MVCLVGSTGTSVAMVIQFNLSVYQAFALGVVMGIGGMCAFLLWIDDTNYR